LILTSKVEASTSDGAAAANATTDKRAEKARRENNMIDNDCETCSSYCKECDVKGRPAGGEREQSMSILYTTAVATSNGRATTTAPYFPPSIDFVHGVRVKTHLMRPCPRSALPKVVLHVPTMSTYRETIGVAG
jgi:hypothetical protein